MKFRSGSKQFIHQNTDKVLLGLRKHHPVAEATRHELGESDLLQCCLPAELGRQCEDGITKLFTLQSTLCRLSSPRSMSAAAIEMLA